MDRYLFNHVDKCRCCFVSFRESQRRSYKLTRQVGEKFYKLTGIQLPLSMNRSKVICDECSGKLIEFSRFQREMIQNQKRLLLFDELLSPRVALSRLNQEDVKVGLDFDPLTSCTIKSEVSVMIKEEVPEYDPDAFDTWFELNPAPELSTPNLEVNAECLTMQKRFPKRDRKAAPLKRASNPEPRVKKSWRNAIGPRIPSGKKLCPHCGKILSKKSLRRHAKMHQNEEQNRALCCDDCDYKTFSKVNIRNHVQSHLVFEMRATFKCSFCSKRFLTKSSLRVHKEKQHLGITKEFKCHCGRVFTSQGGLYEHNKTAHANEQFPCPKCDKVLKSKASLKIHLVSHEPRRACEICGVMVSACHYGTHIRRHTMRFKCSSEGCDKTFKSRFLQRYHLETVHLPPKNVTCLICNVLFTAECRLKMHYEIQHLTVRVKCIMPGCDFTSLRKGLLRLHYRKVHETADQNCRNQMEKHLQTTTFERLKGEARELVVAKQRENMSIKES